MSKILVTGATGLVGKELCKSLVAQGYELVILGRSPESIFRKKFSIPCEYYQWENSVQMLPPAAALIVETVIHLMGESIASGRWTEKKKKEIYESRVFTTKNLVNALNQQALPPKSFISASAIGFYKDCGDQVIDEDSLAADDFMGTLCQDWESESKKVLCRSVQVRTGLVLSNKGGALTQLKAIFKNGLGGPLSDGKHWMSWIHIQDLVRIYILAIQNENLNGPINAVSPGTVTNKTFTKELAHVLKVKAWMPVPRILLRAVLGEMAQVLLSSQNIYSKVLKKENFQFKFNKLSEALKDLEDGNKNI